MMVKCLQVCNIDETAVTAVLMLLSLYNSHEASTARGLAEPRIATSLSLAASVEVSCHV